MSRNMAELANKLGVPIEPVLLSSGRVWSVKSVALATYSVDCENRPGVRGGIEIHWCDQSCLHHWDPCRWRLLVSSARIQIGCADSFAAACDLIAVSYGMDPGGYRR